MGKEPSSPLPSFGISCLSRVEGPSLDPQKKWYVLSKEIIGTLSARLADFVHSVSKIFPDEVQSVSARELRPAKSGSIAAYKNYTRSPRNLYVLSTFGLCVGLLRQREIPPDGLLKSPVFTSVARLVNCIDLELQEAKDLDSGAKPIHDSAQLSAELAEKKVLIESLELELKLMQARTADLESEIERMVTSSIPDHSSSRTPPPCESSPDSSIEDIQNSSNFGSTTKKRKLQKKCKEVMASLHDVSEKYGESISCVLANSFIFGNDAERFEVKDIISDVVEMIMEAKGSKKGLSELLSSETYGRIMRSMRVPDWVLLYFKLQTRLPDSAWQTLPNLTQLGKSKVMYNILDIIRVYILVIISL